jgi:hypothetical protein
MVKTGNLKGVTSLAKLYPLCEEAKPYWFDLKEGLKSLSQFSIISKKPFESFKLHKDGLESTKICENIMKEIVTFLVGCQGNYVGSLFKVLKGSKNSDEFMKKYEACLKDPNLGSLDWHDYNIAPQDKNDEVPMTGRDGDYSNDTQDQI